MANRTMSLDNTLPGSNLTFKEVPALHDGLQTHQVYQTLFVAMPTPSEVQPRIWQEVPKNQKYHSGSLGKTDCQSHHQTNCKFLCKTQPLMLPMGPRAWPVDGGTMSLDIMLLGGNMVCPECQGCHCQCCIHTYCYPTTCIVAAVSLEEPQPSMGVWVPITMPLPCWTPFHWGRRNLGHNIQHCSHHCPHHPNPQQRFPPICQGGITKKESVQWGGLPLPSQWQPLQPLCKCC